MSKGRQGRKGRNKMLKIILKNIDLSLPNLAPLRPFDCTQDMLGGSQSPFLDFQVTGTFARAVQIFNDRNTKDAKGSDGQFSDLRALRVLRGEISFSTLATAPPVLALTDERFRGTLSDIGCIARRARAGSGTALNFSLASWCRCRGGMVFGRSPTPAADLLSTGQNR